MAFGRLPLKGYMFNTEVSVTRFKLSGASIAISGTTATVTLASHLMSVGDLVTFSGVTGATGLNNQTWTVLTVPTTGTYTFDCGTVTGTPAGTIVQEPVFLLPSGMNFVITGANAAIEYNPDNLYTASNSSGETWRSILPVSLQGMVYSDGNAVRIRCNGTTATTYYSNVE
jgi:hypothetical protein